ncbi:MAG: hypothetical protein ABI261_06375 [Ginsengibacter sp.]
MHCNIKEIKKGSVNKLLTGCGKVVESLISIVFEVILTVSH